jgi:hypothetical protein
MEKQRGQFGILALMVFTMVAGVSFAIIRLPLDFYPKLFCLTLLASYFSRWALRDQQRLDAQVRAILVISILTLCVAKSVWARIERGGRSSWEFDLLLIAMVAFWASVTVAYMIMLSRTVRSGTCPGKPTPPP